MVQVASYSAFQEDEEASFRRYSGRGHGFALSHDREYPSAPNHTLYSVSRNHNPSPGEPRAAGHSPESDSTRPRSRIPVAVSHSILDLENFYLDIVLMRWAVWPMPKAKDSLQWGQWRTMHQL